MVYFNKTKVQKKKLFFSFFYLLLLIAITISSAPSQADCPCNKKRSPYRTIGRGAFSVLYGAFVPAQIRTFTNPAIYAGNTLSNIHTTSNNPCGALATYVPMSWQQENQAVTGSFLNTAQDAYISNFDTENSIEQNNYYANNPNLEQIQKQEEIYDNAYDINYNTQPVIDLQQNLD